MSTINTVKELTEADSPLLLFQCLVPNGGGYQYFSTHAINFNGQNYVGRVLKHNLFDFQLSADDAMDSVAQVSLVLANADSMLSEINVDFGWKGTQVTVYFAFADLAGGTITTESAIVFRGIASDPDEITEDTLQLTFTNKLSLLRVGLPEARIQQLCPWNFPTTSDQRSLALNGNRFSRYYRCGYSADVPGGIGNLSNGQAYTSCDHSRATCVQLGMFSTDANGHTTSRFGGLEYIPSTVLVRGFGDKSYKPSRVDENLAKYNDYIPMVYGTGWLAAPVIFARNDGNLTHMEVLLGMGVVDQIFKVVVSGIEIPQGIYGTDMSATGWYNVICLGNASGAFNPDFEDSNGNPLGDPHGSMAALSVVVPNRINIGGYLPHIEVLLQGIHVDQYSPDGSFLTTGFTNNPAWIVLDILQRAGWTLDEINLPTFAQTAAFCNELISTTDLNGNPITVPRYHCNLMLTKRKSSAEIVRGIRVACGLMLRYDATGLLELLPEATIATQQPTLPDGSNATEPLDGGWPAYEFSDGSAPYSGIARDAHGRSTVRVTSRQLAELSNRLSVEYQDETNEYQQDSLSVVDDADQTLIGYELASTSTALGLPNPNQAFRILTMQLGKLTTGNYFIEFETSFRALKLRPGDIITMTYQKEGLNRVPFRITKLTPSTNFRTVTIVAQYHDDVWYVDNPQIGSPAGRQPDAGVSLPRPLLGTAFNANGGTDFGIEEQSVQQTDGSAATTLSVSFAQPAQPPVNGPNLPLLSLSPTIATTGGTLSGNASYYYAVSASDTSGNEGMLSFTVTAAVPTGTSTNSVTLGSLSFPSTAATFNVYRGTNPQLLYRIASAQALAATFVDTGLAYEPVGPPDASFDHANFYYRLEYAGPVPATSATSTTITNADLNATPTVYAGMNVRLIAGTGAGQERTISSNTATTLTVTPAWSVIPDTTTNFVITEASWRFGAVTSTSPAQFQVPNQMGTVVEVTGRGANARDQEGNSDLCPVTRWVVGGDAGGQLDLDTPPAPSYVLNAPGGGDLTLSQVGYATLTNTRSVTAGTLVVTYFNELQMPTPYQLSNALDTQMTSVVLNVALPSQAATPALQIGAEIMTVLSYNSSTNTCTVVRGALGSTVSSHNSGDPVLPLAESVFVAAFARDFFENPASENFAHTVSIPDVRVAASQFYVTNSLGNSPTVTQCYTSTSETGLRTCSGGQLAIQVGGVLAVQQNAAPPLMMEASHAARDVRASITQTADQDIEMQLFTGSTLWCSLTIPANQTTSNIVDGITLATLQSGTNIQLNITQVGLNAPGRDLTVTIRF
ncbi:MAG: phage tail protein [Bryobacteraceae bacterium]